MFNYRLLAIIKRELQEKLVSKGFLIMTVMLPVLMFGLIGVQTFIMSYDGEESHNIEIISESSSLTLSFQDGLNSDESKKDTLNTFKYSTLSPEGFEMYLEEKNNALTNDKIHGIFYIPNTALEDKKVSYYSKIPKNFKLIDKIDGKINKVLVENYFAAKNIPTEELEYARKSVNISRFKISEDEDAKEEGYGNMILAMIFSLLLYISLIMMGQMVLTSVIQEKTNRIVEVLLSSVTSTELLAGKIIGAAITGVLQMVIWMIPIVLVISTTWFALPQDLIFDITMLQIGYLLFNFLLGLITFVGLFATIGSIFENPQDAQSGMWPVMLLIIIPFFVAMSMLSNPTSPIGLVSSMLPFASIIVMPARMTLVDVPLWQFILSVAVSIGTIFAIFPIAGKIYRIGIMVNGKKPKWSEVIGWLKYKY